jgi:MYXO-CTERM domain-containing protein
VYAAQPNAGGYLYLNPADDREAFFWSNIRNVDRWEVLRGSGLLMFHFDYRIRTNDPPNPLGLAVVQADGLDELGGTTWPDPGSDPEDFFHAGSAEEVSDETSPSTHWNDGSASGLRVYDISESAETMTFTVGTGTPEDLTPIYPDNSAGASSAGGAGTSGAGGTQTASGGSGDAGSNTATGGSNSIGGAGASGEGTGGASASTGGTTASTGGTTASTGGTTASTGGTTASTGGTTASTGGTTASTGGTTASTGGTTASGGDPSAAGGAMTPTGGGSGADSHSLASGGKPTAPVETPAQPADSTAPGTQESGCACEAAGAGSSSRGVLLGLLLGLSALARRRPALTSYSS